MTLRILLIEDDPVDADMIRHGLETRLDASISVITTERDFRISLPEIGQNPPDIIIIDVMLRWAKPSPDLTEESVPEDVRAGGFYYAGIRCVELLERDPKTKSIPYIIYTGLDKDNFTRHVVYTKSNDLTSLIEEVRKIMPRDN